MQIDVSIQSEKYHQHGDNNKIKDKYQTAFKSRNQIGFTIKATVCRKKIIAHPENSNRLNP